MFAGDTRGFFFGHNAGPCDLGRFGGKGKHLPVALDALAGLLVIFRVVDDRDKSLLGNAVLHIVESLISAREMDKENLKRVALRVGLDAFVDSRDEVIA